ncbi:cytochrome C assembly family protein [Burkholderia gladioli]|uniref:cytochrome C assembly family protein n=1 Tax=Burkholderia gladioli TaxID=28095 RepID=UPI00163F3D6E|nr:cytochrome c biogenesis protein CcsA [Burkholderia gladioli]MDC6132249.1 cytochrome c biogenesis protein CcsA [Burkholderia gladioli]MDN7921344.1 cytochrome c biogenesis protein CcsA [Burkholderia gladioli]
MDIVLYALTALLYGGLSVAGWRAHRSDLAQPLVASVPAVPRETRPSAASGVSGTGRALLFAALVSHGVLLHATIFPHDAMLFGFAFALSAMFWLGAGIYWIESFFFPLDSLRLLVLPLACVASLLPLGFGGVRVLPYAAAPLFKMHFLIANIAYGLFAIAALHAVLMLMVERRLHALRQGSRIESAGFLAGWLETLPPLLTLEKLLFRLIGAGFVLLTLTLASGILFSEQVDARALRFDHKTVFAILSWFMFGGILVARRLSGWRGRGAARWVLASFGALLLAYVGSRFVLEVLLHRSVV